jgi:hypothetical protein
MGGMCCKPAPDELPTLEVRVKSSCCNTTKNYNIKVENTKDIESVLEHVKRLSTKRAI